MTKEQTRSYRWFRRRSAFGLHVVAALIFGGLMILVGQIPTDSGKMAIIYDSFGPLAVLHVTEYLFNPHLGSFLCSRFRLGLASHDSPLLR